MTKHKPIIISIDDLTNRLFSDSDGFYMTDALEIDPAEVPDIGWVVVTWPEHVINPRYNSDANYLLFETCGDAEIYEPDAMIYDQF